MTEKYVPFGGDEHVVNTDCKLCGPASGLFGSVVFRAREELDSVIAALVKLRDGWDHPTAHIHLQDYGVGKSGGPTSLEVTFTTPSWADTAFEKEIREKSIVDVQKSLATCDVTDNRIGVVLKQLARGPALVRQVIYEVPTELFKRRPAPGVWSAHEHAVHLPAIYPLVMRRLEQMLTEPAPHIKSYEPWRDEPDGALLKLDLDAEMDRFDRERAALVERLRTLTPKQWAITATHDEYSHYSVFIMFRHVALHDLYHAYRIEERLLRKTWD